MPRLYMTKAEPGVTQLGQLVTMQGTGRGASVSVDGIRDVRKYS